MIIIQISLFAILLAVSIYVSITDLCRNTIQNKILLCAVVPGAILDFVYYYFFARNYLKPYFMDLVIVSVISILLYAIHIIAGGDSKLMIMLAIIYPAGWYIEIYTNNYGIIGVVFLAFIYGFVFLIIDSIIITVKYKKEFSYKALYKGFAEFFKQYIVDILYVVAFMQIYCFFIQEFLRLNDVILYFVVFCLVISIRRFKILQQKVLVISISSFDIIMTIITKHIVVSFNLKTYGIIALIVLVRIALSQYNYSEIKTSDVKRGMILSMATTILFQNSRIKGLPLVSTEDLKSRLTIEEAEIVNRWGKSANGQATVYIVRKMPFAIFLTLGFMTYIFLRVVIF